MPLTSAHLAWEATNHRWRPARHLRFIANLLTEIAFSPTPRFVILMTPPRHGKSQLTSRFYPAWYLGVRPHHRVILVSFEQDFARTWGREARTVLEEHGRSLFGVQVNPRSSAAGRWDLLGYDGGMLSAGMGGSIVGRGGHLIIIDDPVKGWEEAQNENYRRKQFEWYQGTLRHRLEPGGSVVLILTRWHEDDLAGKLLAWDDPDADRWEVINLPAIAGENDMLGREIGEALWPRRYDVKALRQIEASVGPLVWESVFQQHPTALEGDMFKTHAWRYASALPHEVTRFVRRIDLAATEKKQGNDPDWTAAVLLGQADNSTDRRIFVCHADRIRGEPGEVERFIRSIAERDEREFHRKIPIVIEQEGGAAGKQVAAHYVTTVLPDFDVQFQTSSGDKVARATPWASQQNAGNVYLLLGPWNDQYVEEHRQFPRGAHDDVVDASALAWIDLAGQITRSGVYERSVLRGSR